MAEYQHTQYSAPASVQATDHGLFDSEQNKDQEKIISSEFQDCKTEEEMHHHKSHTSSSSDEEKEDHDTEVLIEKIHVEEQQTSEDLACPPPTPVVEGEEKKKGFLDKIKDKIPTFRSKPTSQDDDN